MQRVIAFGVLCLCLIASPARAERFYMTVFGYQDTFDVTTHSHTFATFVTDSQLAQGISPDAMATISWLPESGEIDRVQFQRGRNYTLPETIALARTIPGMTIRAWGPFEITPQLYQRAMQRIAYLRPENVWYKMIDGLHRTDYDDSELGMALNCIHALSDIGGLLSTHVLHGFSASRTIVGFLSPSIVGYPAVHPEIAERMHLNEIVTGG